jgi:hypothetical protein
VNDSETPTNRQTVHMPAWLRTTTYVVVPIVILLLLVLHTLKLHGVDIDTTSLGLVALLLLAPLAPYVRRLSAAGVEAEIGPQEARELRASAAELPAPAQLTPEVAAEAPTIQELIDRDPPLGLANLRIELEREVRTLYENTVPDAARPGMSLSFMTRELQKRQVLPPEIAAPLADVTALANRAIHGEYVQPDVAADIASVGLRLLNALQLMNQELQRQND